MQKRLGTQVNRKAQMNLCDYQILEYTTSELQIHGVPFIVVVRLHEVGSYALQIFVLRRWEVKTGVASQREVGEIETFLEDLRLKSSEQSSIATSFERLANLNIGPIRAFVSGSCSEHDLNEVIQEFFDVVRGSPSWQEHFDEFSDLDRANGVSR
jgi:hypothetical protein